MTAARATFIRDVLEEHLDELNFLLGQRVAALNSHVLTLRGLCDLEERIEAHVEGLLATGENILPFLLPGLEESSTSRAFASAYPLLRLGQAVATEQVWKSFTAMEGEGLHGLIQALCACCPVQLKTRLINQAAGIPSVRSAAALEVLAYTSVGDVKRTNVMPFLSAETLRIQQAGWRLVALANISIPRELYEKALTGNDPAIRQESLWAAAWTEQPWLLDFCRNYAVKNPPADTLPFRMLAVLGQPHDLQRILYLGKDSVFGPQRYEWLGAYGHPGVIDLIVEGIKSQKPREAVAAGTAFTKITGFDVESDKRVTLPPEDGHKPDELEKEFLDDAFLPDFDTAQAHWQKVQSVFANGTRWSCGRDVSQLNPSTNAKPLDMKSYGEAILRAKWSGKGQRARPDIDRFPYRANDTLGENG